MDACTIKFLQPSGYVSVTFDYYRAGNFCFFILNLIHEFHDYLGMRLYACVQLWWVWSIILWKDKNFILLKGKSFATQKLPSSLSWYPYVPRLMHVCVWAWGCAWKNYSLPMQLQFTTVSSLIPILVEHPHSHSASVIITLLWHRQTERDRGQCDMTV